MKKTMILAALVLMQSACSVNTSEESYEEMVTTVNKESLVEYLCLPVENTERFVNIDCKVKAVGSLKIPVRINEQPVLSHYQLISKLESASEVCTILSEDEIHRLNLIIYEANEKMLNLKLTMSSEMRELLDEEQKNQEMIKEVDLVIATLKGQYEKEIDQRYCQKNKE